MTRGKAIATVAAELGCVTGIAAHQVDALVALGILKLDEPKTREQPHEIVAKAFGWGAGGTQHLKDVLDRCGLRIVEA